MRIPPQKVDEIYRAMDITEIIGDYVVLKRKGANYWALSPFVKEKSPSFAVNPAKGIYKCFSSGKGGNAVSFLMEMEGYTYVEALMHVAKKYNIEVEVDERADDYQDKKNHHESLYILNQFAADYYHRQLLESEEGKTVALTYFKERGISEATIKQFQLGYALDSWDNFAKEALARQYTENLLTETGLCSKSEKTGNLVDRFRARVMFPITNHVGKIVGFGGRILGNKDKEAKYINSPETAIYQKSQVLFGLFQGRNAIREQNLCILTEGYMDVIALFQSGIQNTVASSGTSLTEEQSRLIKRFAKNVLLVYDGDSPGVKAALRAIDLLIAEGLSVKVLILPDNHDPDSYTKQYGAAAFMEQAKTAALDFMEFKIRQLLQDADQSPRAQTERLQALAQTILHIPDSIEQKIYAKTVANRLQIDETLMDEALRQTQKQLHKEEQRELRRQNVQKPAEVIEMKAFEKLDLATQEKELLRVLVNHHDKVCELGEGEGKATVVVHAFLSEELEGLEFENPLYERVKQEIFTSYSNQNRFDLNRYINQADEQTCGLISELLSPKHALSENWKDYDMLTPKIDENVSLSIEDPLLYYKYRKIEKLLLDAKKKLTEAQTPEEETHYLELFMYLRGLQNDIEKRKAIEGAKNPL